MENNFIIFMYFISYIYDIKLISIWKNLKPMSGYLALLISILLLFGAVALFFTGMQYNPFLSVMGVLCFILAIFL